MAEHDWSDVQRLKQYEGNPTILNLKYDEKYEKLMDYCRAIIQSNEISIRVYDLTTSLLNFNASNYNLYIIRRKCLQQLNLDLDQEMKFVNDLTFKNEKCYQIWEHRRQIIDWTKKYDYEIQFLQEILGSDNKNYHAWQYRIWLCQQFNLFDQEIKNVEYFIEEDVGNNSAWNYRYFLLVHLDFDFEQELKYIKHQIELKPTNEAVWNYLRGWFRVDEQQNKHQKFKQFKYQEYDIVDFVDKYVKEDVRFAIAFIIEIKVHEKQFEQAIQLCLRMGSDIDPIRHNYWNWKIENIKKLQ
ncbi:hypothetical protein pb186bvf_019452 [Paramecium bursaria]